MNDGLITSATTFFDYGCGHGADLRFLQARHVPARGWDPHFTPDQPVIASQVVNLGFVLNVIEEPNERARTLERAWSVTEKLLIVAVRIDRTLVSAEEFGDGLLTARGTFQKIFTQMELREYIHAVLGCRAHVVDLGIVYVFKDPEWEARYIAARAFTGQLEYRTDLIQEFSKSRTALRLVEMTTALGRLPLAEEFKGWPRLLEHFGSEHRIKRLVLQKIRPETWEGSRSQRRNDLLTYMATLRLSGVNPPPWSSLPPVIQSDIKALFKSYTELQEEGQCFLFSLGDPGAVKAACRTSPVGKLLPEDLYVHRSVEEELPALLRVMLHAGRQIVGESDYNVLKLSLHGRSLSFLNYSGFDEVAHPALQTSMRVYLPKAEYQIRDYRASANPPILHRKETLIGKDYPHAEVFRQLTAQEDAAGLLSANDIGFRQAWEARLIEQGWRIEGHQLLLLTSAD